MNYIDAVQSIGLPGDPCPMCQAEAGIFVLDDVPDYFKAVITSNEACDGSVGSVSSPAHSGQSKPQGQPATAST